MTKSRFDMKIFFTVLIPLCALLSCAHKEPEFNYPISVKIRKLHKENNNKDNVDIVFSPCLVFAFSTLNAPPPRFGLMTKRSYARCQT